MGELGIDGCVFGKVLHHPCDVWYHAESSAARRPSTIPPLALSLGQSVKAVFTHDRRLVVAQSCTQDRRARNRVPVPGVAERRSTEGIAPRRTGGGWIGELEARLAASTR